MPILWILICVAALVVLLIGEYPPWPKVKAVAKPVASTAFIMVALVSDALQSGYGVAIVVALVLSWWGDVFLLSLKRHFFLAGLGAFLAGHVAYCVAFVVAGLDVLYAGITLVAAVLPAWAVIRWLLPRLEDRMRRPVLAYIGVITVMVALAVGAVAAGNTPWIAVAAVAFYLSDLSVARDRFVAPGFDNRIWGLPLYYGAQVVFACTVAL